MNEFLNDTVLDNDVIADNSGLDAGGTNPNQAADDADNNSAKKELDAEKVNEIVKGRTKRYLKENAQLKSDLEAEKADAEKFRMIKSALKNNGMDTPEAQANAFSEYFGISKDAFLTPSSNKEEQSKGDAYVDARQFLDAASDDEVIAEVEHLLEKRSSSPKSFSVADNVRLTELNNAYAKIRYQRDVAVASKYCSDNGLDFDTLVKDADFIEFVKDLNVPISTAVKKYARFTKSTPATEPPKAQPATTGSVKDSGGSVAKEFYSREEVAKMTREEIRKNLDVIHKSQSKW